MASRPDLAELLTRASREIHSRDDVDATLTAIVQCLHDGLPADHHVGLCLQRRPGDIETAAVSDELVRVLEKAQHGSGQGTCPVAIEGRNVALVDPLADQKGWQRYLPVALDHGVHAQVSVRLAVEERVWGAITVYALGDAGISRDTERLATLFGAHAATAVDRSHREENLRVALSTRKLIGQAIGLAMERFELDEELAFRYLVRLSSTSNVKLREIARDLVDEANRKGNGGA